MVKEHHTYTGMTPWKDGRYTCKGMPMMMIRVCQENVEYEFAMHKGTLKHGEFGEADPAVTESTGKKFYNWEMTTYYGYVTVYGVLSDNGETVTFINNIKQLDTYQWVSEEEFATFEELGDQVDAPSSHYKPQPENQGKLVFIAGPPGSGKSTTGLLLSKMAGYVYYEADAFTQCANPFLPPHTKEPSLEVMAQKPLIGMSQERRDVIYGRIPEFKKMMKGEPYDVEPIKAFYSALCGDVSKQRKRLGGDWVVVLPLPNRAFRDFVRAEMGPDLVLVVLRMEKYQQKKRIFQRHGEVSKLLDTIYDLYDHVEENEINTIKIEVTADTTRNEIVHNVLEMVK